MEIMFNDGDYELLQELGIDVFPTDRKYWFIRTQGGLYYDDFVNECFVGIEWDEISDLELIKNRKEEKLKLEVIKNYPKIEKPGYPISQILRFANDIKKGDIVIIPNEKSQWISIGEFIDDEMYIYEEEEDFEDILESLDEESKEKKQILKKRRRVKWLTKVKRSEWDPYLYGIIYSHNAVSNADKYNIFIDRLLSQFYIKGEKAYFTYKVNKKKNIPYNDMLKFLNNNDRLISYINRNSSTLNINSDNLVLKINVQSKGPVQLKGAVRDVLIIGLVIGAVFGTNMKFKILGMEYNVQTEGLPGLINSVKELMDEKHSNDREDELQSIIDGLEEDKKKLELRLPVEEIQNKQEENENCITEVK